MTDVAVDDHWLAVDHIDRESLTHFHRVRIGEHYVEHQGLSCQCGFAAERNPFVALALLDNYIRENPEHAVSGFGQPVSLVASSVRHSGSFSNGDAVVRKIE